jgi:hypothetical protein
LLALAAEALLSCNCSKSRPQASTENAPAVARLDAGLSLSAPMPFHCDPSAQGESLTLGSTGGVDEDDDSGLDVPFAINVGPGVGLDHGFAVTAVDGRGGKSQAVLALMNVDTQQGRKLDLGRVYGDADPPRIAGNAARLVLAVADMDASGRTLSLTRVDAPLTQPRLTRGGDIPVVQNPATVFSLAVDGDQGVLVWDQADRGTENNQIALAPFSVQTLALPTKPQILSSKQVDADSPNVIVRPGGYWAAWIQTGSSASRPPLGKVATTKATSHSKGESTDDNLKLVDMGTRELHVLTLDAKGRPLGKPVRVSEGASHVVAYDMSLLDDGAALLAWRDDDRAPGVESQIVRLARAGLDGHVENFRIEDESIGVGVPQLLIDTTAPAADRAWLAIINTGDKTSLAKLLPNGKPLGTVVADADLGVASPVVRHQGRLLLVRQRGKGVDVEALHCMLNVPIEGQPPPSASGVPSVPLTHDAAQPPNDSK